MADIHRDTSKEYISVNVNTLRPRENGRHFADAIFKCISLNEGDWIPLDISLKLVPMGPITNIPTLVQIMAWRRPLYEPMMVRLATHICVTPPQWVKAGIMVENALVLLRYMVKPLIYVALNTKTHFFLVSSRLYPSHWSQVLSREWRARTNCF